jgi:hypothetical protein
VAAIAAHSFCNFVGFPEDALSEAQDGDHRWPVRALLIIGIVLFFVLFP